MEFPGMFEAEANGLEILQQFSAFIVPKVFKTGIIQNKAYLLMEFLETGAENDAFWQVFGENLAALHRQPAKYFGLPHSNYIGSLKQSNTFHESWSDFYAEERLLPQAKMAQDQGFLSKEEVGDLERICDKLPSLIPDERPSLLHGDLWSGNYLCTASLQPALIDPSVYFGHREMDLAMTRLFGGFPDEFYRAYQNAFPLQPGNVERTTLFQLYPLLVHLNLFGKIYQKAVNNVIIRFR